MARAHLVGRIEPRRSAAALRSYGWPDQRNGRHVAHNAARRRRLKGGNRPQLRSRSPSRWQRAVSSRRRPTVRPPYRRQNAGHVQASGRSKEHVVSGARPRSARSDGHKVWITGIGVITAIGIGRDGFWDGLHAQKSRVKRIDRFDPSQFRSQVAAQVDDFEPTDHMDAKAARQTDRFSQFALAAGRMAIDDAELSVGARGSARPDRFGVYIGSALGGIAYAEIQHEKFIERGI